MNIKNLNILLGFVVCLLITPNLIAQEKVEIEKETIESVKESRDKMESSLTELNESDQYEVLTEALKSSNADVKKMMKKALKKMTPEQRAQILRYSEAKKAMADKQKARAAKKIASTKPAKKPKLRTPIQHEKKATPSTKSKTMAKSSKITQPDAPVGPTTTVEFEETAFDFGIIDQGESVTYVFKFKNTGKEPFIISNAKGSCGCTVPKWPKEPIAAGATSQIEVTFNSRGKKGKQNKRVTITGNSEPTQSMIYMKGHVDVPTPAKTGGGK